LYLTIPVSGSLSTIVLTRVDDSVLDKYFIRYDLNDFLKKHEVDLKKYEVSLDQYKVNIEKYKVNISPNNSVSGLSCPDSKHPHAIDMGVAGKWACCNVGASSPEEFGGYYAWGETEEKDNYAKSTYKYYDSSSNSYIYLGDDIAGTSYDVAHVKWGGKWKMPSLERINLLLGNCSSDWCEYNLYGDANIENCYNINGKIYRIENTNGYYLINDLVYKFDNVNDFKNYYLINGKTFKLDNINGYYFINDKIYKLDNVSNYYTVDDKIYNIDNSYGYYLNCNDLYIIPSGEVTGLEYFSAEKLQTSGSLNDLAVSNIAVSFANKKLVGTVNGRIFTSKNGNKIFLPAAGGRWNDYTYNVGSYGHYWSSTQNPDYSYDAYSLDFYSGGVGTYGYDRRSGHSVRPVTD